MSTSPLVALPGLTPGLSAARVFERILGTELNNSVLAVDAAALVTSVNTDGAPLDALVTALASSLDDAGLQKVHLLAESWSATVALRFAATFPDRVDELVLVSPLGYSSPLTAHRRTPGSLAENIRKLYSGDAAQAAVALEVLGGGTVELSPLAAEYAAAVSEVRQAASTLAEWLEKGAFELVGSENPDLVRGVRHQVSLVWGRDDLWAGLDSAFYLTRRLRNVRLRVYPGVGHLSSLEAPAYLGRHIRSVLGLPLPDAAVAR